MTHHISHNHMNFLNCDDLHITNTHREGEITHDCGEAMSPVPDPENRFFKLHLSQEVER